MAGVPDLGAGCAECATRVSKLQRGSSVWKPGAEADDGRRMQTMTPVSPLSERFAAMDQPTVTTILLAHLTTAENPERRLRLMEQARRRLRERRYSSRTESAYLHWIRRYVIFHGRQHPAFLGADLRTSVAWSGDLRVCLATTARIPWIRSADWSPITSRAPGTLTGTVRMSCVRTGFWTAITLSSASCAIRMAGRSRTARCSSGSVCVDDATLRAQAERGLTVVGADGRAIDGGRSAAALLKRSQHNLAVMPQR